MKPVLPAEGPPWLRRFADSIIAGLKAKLAAPFWLWSAPTIDLPTTTDLGANAGAIAYDETGARPTFFNGAAWTQLQPYDRTLSGLAALPAVLGLVEQTGVDTFGIRPIGITNASDVLTRASGDGRYAAIGTGVLSFNARTGAVTLTSGDITGGLGFTPTSVAGLTGAQTVAGFKAGLSLAKADVGLGNVDNNADAAKNVLSATKLTTGRTIGISGAVTGTATAFDGSGNITIPITALDVGAASTGILAVARGGTGAATVPGAIAALRSGCMVKKSADQIGANYTAGPVITWDAEAYDDGGWHDNTTNNSRLSVPVGLSRVRVGCNIKINNGTSASSVFLSLLKNGAVAFDGACSVSFVAGQVGPVLTFASGPIPVTGGTDYFEVSLFYATDTAIDIIAAQTNFWIEAA